MNKQYRIRALILQEFQASRTPRQACDNVCRQLGEKATTTGTVRKWFKKFETGDTNIRNKNDPQHDEPLEIGNDVYVSANKSVLFAVDDWRLNNGIVTSNGRVAFAFISATRQEIKTTSFIVVDLFHGRIREIPLQTLSFYREDYNYKIKCVDDERLLFVGKHDNKSVSHFWLLRFNFETLQCSVIGQATLNSRIYDVIMDQSNPNKFLADNRAMFWRGECIDNGVSISNAAIRSGDATRCMGYGADRRFGLHHHDLNPFQYIEYDAGASALLNTINVPAILKDDGMRAWSLYNIEAYHWAKEGLYAAVRTSDYLDAVIYLLSNVEWTWTKLPYVVMGQVTSMFVDADGFLVVSTFENVSKNLHLNANRPCQNAVHRFALKKPDSLINLAWFAVRFYHTFRASGIYERLSKRLPFNSYLRCVLPDA